MTCLDFVVRFVLAVAVAFLAGAVVGVVLSGLVAAVGYLVE